MKVATSGVSAYACVKHSSAFLYDDASNKWLCAQNTNTAHVFDKGTLISM